MTTPNWKYDLLNITVMKANATAYICYPKQIQRGEVPRDVSCMNQSGPTSASFPSSLSAP